MMMRSLRSVSAVATWPPKAPPSWSWRIFPRSRSRRSFRSRAAVESVMTSQLESRGSGPSPRNSGCGIRDSASDRGLSLFAGADAGRGLEVVHEDLAVADLAGPGRLRDRLDDA